jgi:hypothetical protein
LEAISLKPTSAVLIKRKEWAIDGAKAWDEYLAARAVVAAKTARLKQERLEKAAGEKVAAEKAVIEGVRLNSAPKAKKNPKTANLRKTKLIARNNSAAQQ